MQMIKIQIPDKAESAKALVEMSGRGRVLCFADDVYIVPEPALELLTKLSIQYQELGRGGFDYADDLRRIVVDVEDTPENREFFSTYKPVLCERFQQIEIYIASHPVDIV